MAARPRDSAVSGKDHLPGRHDGPYTLAMPVQIVPLPDYDEHYDQGWERVTDEFELYGIDASKLAGKPWWQVGVAAAEFISAPLPAEFQSDFRHRIATALRSVAGVERVDEEDREVWLVTGQPPSALALIEAVAPVLDDLAPLLRPHIYPADGHDPHGQPPTPGPPPESHRFRPS